MNFSGVFRTFPRPMRPRRISFRVRLQTPCSSRSFFNLFLSSSSEVFKDKAGAQSGDRAYSTLM
jgi:hypothetical protein